MKHAIKETLLIIISSSVSLEAMFLGDCLPMDKSRAIAGTTARCAQYMSAQIIM